MPLPSAFPAFSYLVGEAAPLRRALMRALYQRQSTQIALVVDGPTLEKDVLRTAAPAHIESSSIRDALYHLRSLGLIDAQKTSREVRSAAEWHAKPTEYRLTTVGAEIEAFLALLEEKTKSPTLTASDLDTLVMHVRELDTACRSDGAVAQLIADGRDAPGGVAAHDCPIIVAFHQADQRLASIQSATRNYLSVLDTNLTSANAEGIAADAVVRTVVAFIQDFGQAAQRTAEALTTAGYYWRLPDHEVTEAFATWLTGGLQVHFPTPSLTDDTAARRLYVLRRLRELSGPDTAGQFFRDLHGRTLDTIQRLYELLVRQIERVHLPRADRTPLLATADRLATVTDSTDAVRIASRTLGALGLVRWQGAPLSDRATAGTSLWSHPAPLIELQKRLRGRPALPEVGATQVNAAQQAAEVAAHASRRAARQAALFRVLQRTDLRPGGDVKMSRLEFEAYDQLCSEVAHRTLEADWHPHLVSSAVGTTAVGRVRATLPRLDDPPLTIVVEDVGTARVPAVEFRMVVRAARGGA